MRQVSNIVVATAIAAGSLSSVALAGIVAPTPIGGGWGVIVPNIDGMDVIRDSISIQGDAIVIETQANHPGFGAECIQLVQLAPDSATLARIIITDSVVVNSSGQAWNGYSYFVGANDPATFNQSLSAGFSISPFTTRTYGAGSRSVAFGGGSLPSGAVWFPGLTNGELVIDVDLSGGPAFITLCQQALPTPGAAALLGIGGLVATRRRR